MNDLSSKPLDMAFIPACTPMFSEVMQKVEVTRELNHTRRRDILSGLRRVASALNRRPEDIPADAVWLQPRLKHVASAALRLSPKSWSNAMSDARAGLVLYGVVDRRISRKTELSPEWRPIWEIVLQSRDPSLTRSLPRLVHFLNRLGVSPHSVNLSDIDNYREGLVLNELSRSPDQAYRSAVNAWNLAVRRVPEWPRQTFVLPSRSRRIALDVAAFPEAFSADLERFLDSLAHPDPLEPHALLAPLRPTTIAQYRAMIRRFASALVQAGLPIASIDGLAALVVIDNAKLGLRWMLVRTKGRPTPGTADMINLLRSIARRHVRVDTTTQDRLDKMNARLAGPDEGGLTAKNRDRLRPLQDPDTLRRLLLLPEQVFEAAKPQVVGKEPLLRQEEALAIAILLNCPIRSNNLAQIQLERNLQRPGDGRVFLVFEPDEVKNKRRIEFELPQMVVRMIDTHLASRVAGLCAPANPWLFPRRTGEGPINTSHFASRIKKCILRETGLVMNAHLFRHLAAMNWLDAFPGQYEVVKRLLGHSSVSQTLNFYAGFEAGTATRLFAEVIDAKRRT